MDAIEGMLDAAMDGSFSETTFDESKLSALETNLRTIFPRQRFLLEMRPGKKTE